MKSLYFKQKLIFVLIIGVLFLFYFGKGLLRHSGFYNLVDMLYKNPLSSDKPSKYAPDILGIDYDRSLYPQGKVFKLYQIKNVSVYKYMVINGNINEFGNQSFYNPILYDYLKKVSECKKDAIKEYFFKLINNSKGLFIEFDVGADKRDGYQAGYLWVLDREGNYRNIFIELSILGMIEHDFSQYQGYKYETTSNIYTNQAKRLYLGFYNKEFNKKCLKTR